MPVRKRMFFECAGLLLVSIGLLVGCATRSACTMGANVVQRIFSAHGEIDQTLLNPAFAYVRVTRAGSPAFLALGAQRLDGGLKRETHYSSQRETLELLDGRVVSLDADGEMFRWNTPSAPKWVSLKLETGRLPKASCIDPVNSFSVRMAMQRVGLIDIGMCGLASVMFNGVKYSPP